jgi:hydroxymethylglutaryl-CoA lyase
VTALTAARLRDVTLRDGLQLTGRLLPTERKIGLVRTLLAAGVPELEIGSLARGDLVPPMADTLDVIAALTPEELERCWVWVATPRHVERAAAAGARRFQYCFSASDSHNRANIGRPTEASLDAMPDAVALAH